MASKSQSVLQEYLEGMRAIRATGDGVDERSYYAPLSNLLNGEGAALKFPVQCVLELRDRGSGHPDGGLYEKAGKDENAPSGDGPKYGAMEVKPLSANVHEIAADSQVEKYLKLYKRVLVTNYRQFLLVEERDGGTREVEEVTLASSEEEFWEIAAHPIRSSKHLDTEVASFFHDVFSRSTPLVRVDDVARVLARNARKALKILEANPPASLNSLKKRLQASLGASIQDGEEGQHFFLSTLVQALFYGMFVAWVSRAEKGGEFKFDWRTSAYDMTLPVLQSLFHEITNPSISQPLGLDKLLDKASESLSRVIPDAFFAEMAAEETMHYFYEPFLEHFDPVLKDELGVWYTPKEVVRYMVERVDRVLREELDIPLGLADENVYVLDPCCGTGAYPVAVLRRIHKTLLDAGLGPDLASEEVKKAAMHRVFGFEVQAAPLVISHWFIKREMGPLGVHFDPQGDERAAVYLTDSLTGWKPTDSILDIEGALRDEQVKASKVKRSTPILVILGNPPYNAYAEKTPEMKELVEPYKEGTRERGIKKFNLDDPYICFFRIAQNRIAETKKGVVCYITNHSYLTGKSYVGLRKNLVETFDKVWMDDLHGAYRKSDGANDPSIFDTPYNQGGIDVGTSVGLLLLNGKSSASPAVLHRDVRGPGKRRFLGKNWEVKDFDAQYETLHPNQENWFYLKPVHASDAYMSWPMLTQLCFQDPLDGLLEVRRGSLISITLSPLKERMKAYYDRGLDWEGFSALGTGLSTDMARFRAKKTRAKVFASGEQYEEEKIIRYFFKSFDVRYAYVSEVRPVWNDFRPTLWKRFQRGENRFLISRPVCNVAKEGSPILYTQILGDYDSFSGKAKHIPFRRLEENLSGGTLKPNLSDRATQYLKDVGHPPAEQGEGAETLLWMHALAIGFSREYREEHANALKRDWPRVPLPSSKKALEASAALGEQVAALLDTEAPVPGVTETPVAPHLKKMAVLVGQNLSITAPWSIVQTNRITPSKGDVRETRWEEGEMDAIEAGLSEAGIDPEKAKALFEGFVDIHLNDSTRWRGVPKAAWEFCIGGNHLLKKWLSYRKIEALGRALEASEAREFMNLARRLAAVVLLTDALDANYRAARDASFDWASLEAAKAKARKKGG